jgi:hypothetical protein
MTFDPIRTPVDYALVAGTRTPGLCEILGANSPRRWDVRRGTAFSGATVVYRGTDLAKPTMRLRLYTEQHWQDWHAFAPLVLRELPPDAADVAQRQRRGQSPPPAQRRPRALDIWHPILEDLGIRSVVVEDVLQPVQTGDGEWTIDVKLIEYRVPVFALAQPEGAQDQPRDRFEVMIEEQNARNQVLRDRLAAGGAT